MNPAEIPLYPSVQRRLKKMLSPARFQHTLGCAEFAAELARRHGGAWQQAYLAGLVHDCARELSPRILARRLRRYHGKHCPPATRDTPELWHNPVGIMLARNVFKIRDPKILRTIALHSTGAPNLNLLDQIVYVADYCEPNRHYPGAGKLRALALKNLDQAVLQVTRGKVAYMLRAGKKIHPLTRQLAQKLGIKVR